MHVDIIGTLTAYVVALLIGHNVRAHPFSRVGRRSSRQVVPWDAIGFHLDAPAGFGAFPSRFGAEGDVFLIDFNLGHSLHDEPSIKPLFHGGLCVVWPLALWPGVNTPLSVR
jgi:hypothetical protein